MSLLSLLSDFVSGAPDSSLKLVGARPPEVGAIYRHLAETGPVEYAQVIGLHTDEGGIRHIRFELMLGYCDKVVQAGERTLSYGVFAKRFPEWLEGAPRDDDTQEVSRLVEEPVVQDTPLARRA